MQIRQPNGTLIGRWGEKGSGPGQYVSTMHGAWMDSDGSLYIAEPSVNNRLQKFVRV